RKCTGTHSYSAHRYSRNQCSPAQSHGGDLTVLESDRGTCVTSWENRAAARWQAHRFCPLHGKTFSGRVPSHIYTSSRQCLGERCRGERRANCGASMPSTVLLPTTS